jgi:AcrR family transcriptional regulator
VTVRKEQAAQTEADLKKAARVVFERQGYLNTKITDITREAGRAAGSFYTHFPSKDAILEALLADMLVEVDESLAFVGHNGDFNDPEGVRWHVAAYWNFYRQHKPVVQALQQAAITSETFAERLRELMAPDIGHMAAHLRDAAEAGAVLPGDPHIVATMISSLLGAWASEWIDGKRGPDDEGITALTGFIYSAIHSARIGSG